MAASIAKQLKSFGRAVVDRLPRYSSKKMAHRLVLQANVARDMQQFELAAVLYDEALRALPGNARIHVQCGHMLKEARQFDRAERQYEQALALRPDDPDLAMQLGHFYKVAGRIDEARESYERAADLRPGWIDAEEEIARTGGMIDRSEQSIGVLIPELAPRPSAAGSVQSSAFRLLRLGHRRARGEGRGMKELSGIEAIRGYRVTNLPLTEIRLVVDGVQVFSAPLRLAKLKSAQSSQHKYVFNLWYDFSNIERGRHEVSLRLMAGPIIEHSHREYIFIEDAPRSEAALYSDAFVPLVAHYRSGLDTAINAAASIVRSTNRSPLPHDIQTILVQRVDQLGDFVVSVPAIQRLRSLFPEAKLVALLTAANFEVARSTDLFENIIVADYRENLAERRRTITAEAQAAVQKALSAYDFDLAVDLGEGAESRPLLLLSNAKFLYGFKDREAPWLSAGFEMNVRDPLDGLETLSPARKILAMIEALGVLRGRTSQPLPTRGGNAVLERYGLADGTQYIVLHTGARLECSRWQGFPALAKMLLQQTDLTIVAFSDELNDWPADDRVIVLPGLLPFEDFDAVLSECAIFVGNDSGPKHLAALRGRRTVSVHMARLNWSEWGQEGDGLIVSRRVPCAGCAIQHHPDECAKDFACLTNIRPSEVFEAISALL